MGNSSFHLTTVFSIGLGICTLLIWSQNIHAEIFKWRDDKGGIHYSEHPPKGAKAERVTTYHNSPSQPYVPDHSTPGNNTQNAKTAAANEKTKGKTAEEKAQDKKSCEIARQNLKTLSEHARIRSKDESGAVTVLSPEQKQQEVGKAKKAIENYC